MSGLIQQPPEEAASCSLILCWLRQAGGKMAIAIPGRLPRLGHSKGEKKNRVVQGSFQKPLKRPFILTHAHS